MMLGMPGGRQLADGLSSGLGWLASSWALAAYAGVSEGAVIPPVTPPAPGGATSQTPLKSGSFARAAQSAAAGAGRVAFCATDRGPKISEAAIIPNRILPMCPRTNLILSEMRAVWTGLGCSARFQWDVPPDFNRSYAASAPQDSAAPFRPGFKVSQVSGQSVLGDSFAAIQSLDATPNFGVD